MSKQYAVIGLGNQFFGKGCIPQSGDDTLCC